MSDHKKDPDMIEDQNLDDVQGGMKIPNIFSGDGKVINSFDTVTIDAKTTLDKTDLFKDTSDLTKTLK